MWQRPRDIDRTLQESVGSLSNPLTLSRNFEGLKEACLLQGVSAKGLNWLALTASEVNTVALTGRYGPGWFDGSPTEADLISQGWTFMGFDILDLRGLISGLSGCDYRPDTKQLLRSYFDSALNEVGLFETYRLASEFAEVRGLEIHEHAPFIPIGVLIRTQA